MVAFYVKQLDSIAVFNEEIPLGILSERLTEVSKTEPKKAKITISFSQRYLRSIEEKENSLFLRSGRHVFIIKRRDLGLIRSRSIIALLPTYSCYTIGNK